jgi:hypothetical protein
VLKYSQRINELLEKEMGKDRRIADLEREMRVLEQRREGEEERRRREGEQKFSNYLKLPVAMPEDSFSSIASRSSFQKSSLQVLQSQVKQKDS